MFLLSKSRQHRLVFFGVLLLALQMVCSVSFALAESEASSEAASESGAGGGRGRGWWRYQMMQQRAQQRMAAQQNRKQQQMQMQQKRKQNMALAAQRNKPFRVSDYIHEYGSGKRRHPNLSALNGGNASGPSPSRAQTVGGAPLGALPATSSVPFQKFPPK